MTYKMVCHVNVLFNNCRSDFITQETSFTFVPSTEIKSLHYRADPEYSDTESELDNLRKLLNEI